MSQQEPPPASPQVPLGMSPEVFEGKWANLAILQRSPHEYTLDFYRLGPMGQQGLAVARISFSPLLLADLKSLVDAHWAAYTEEAGIPPDDGFSDDD